MIKLKYNHNKCPKCNALINLELFKNNRYEFYTHYEIDYDNNITTAVIYKYSKVFIRDNILEGNNDNNNNNIAKYWLNCQECSYSRRINIDQIKFIEINDEDDYNKGEAKQLSI